MKQEVGSHPEFFNTVGEYNGANVPHENGTVFSRPNTAEKAL